MAEDSVPERAGGAVPSIGAAVRRHERLAALHEALAARGSGDVGEHARKAKLHRDEADRLRRGGEPGDDASG